MGNLFWLRRRWRNLLPCAHRRICAGHAGCRSIGHAGDFTNIAGVIQVFEPGIAVDMHPATVSHQMILGVLTFAVAGEAIPTGGWNGAAPGALLATVSPQPRGLGLAGARCQHRDRGIVDKDRLTGQHMPSDGIGQRFQQGGGFTDPVRERRAANIEPVAVKELALAVKRKVIGVFVDQDIGKKARTRASALDGARWQRSLREAIAARAGHQMILIRSPRRPRNTKRCPANGSCFRTASACAAKAANPLRMSVTPAASQTELCPKVDGAVRSCQPRVDGLDFLR